MLQGSALQVSLVHASIRWIRCQAVGRPATVVPTAFLISGLQILAIAAAPLLASLCRWLRHCRPGPAALRLPALPRVAVEACRHRLSGRRARGARLGLRCPLPRCPLGTLRLERCRLAADVGLLLRDQLGQGNRGWVRAEVLDTPREYPGQGPMHASQGCEVPPGCASPVRERLGVQHRWGR